MTDTFVIVSIVAIVVFVIIFAILVGSKRKNWKNCQRKSFNKCKPKCDDWSTTCEDDGRFSECNQHSETECNQMSESSKKSCQSEKKDYDEKPSCVDNDAEYSHPGDFVADGAY